jgi:hypothetical protein
MIFRLSSKLAYKLKVSPPGVLPRGPSPFLDWSAHQFTAARMQFVIVSNTSSLYAVVFQGRGLSNDGLFVERALSSLRNIMEHDGLALTYRRFIAPACHTVQFSKALNRSVTGSMNDLIVHAKLWLTERELSPHETAARLNDIPFSSLDYRNPREAFIAMEAACNNEA